MKKMSDDKKDSIKRACLCLPELEGKNVEVIARKFKDSKGGALFPYNLEWTQLPNRLETTEDDKLFYCFVHTEKTAGDKPVSFYLIPSNIVAKSIQERHAYWKGKKPDGKERGRGFGLGTKRDFKYSVKTPLAEDYKVAL